MIVKASQFARKLLILPKRLASMLIMTVPNHGDNEQSDHHDHDPVTCEHHHGPSDTGTAVKRLKAAGVRLTKPRLALIEVLAGMKGPASIEKLHSATGEGVCDLATVYRNLAAFEEVGVVRRMHFENGTALYELEATPGSHHHHVVCRVCRKVDPIEGCVVAPLEEEVRARGYTAVTHVIELFGVCPECATKRG
jgi:Fur family transcriptional regulator, ferric uptake regulator